MIIIPRLLTFTYNYYYNDWNVKGPECSVPISDPATMKCIIIMHVIAIIQTQLLTSAMSHSHRN